MTFVADYIAERLGAELIENDSGFIAYTLRNQECFIWDFFITARARGLGLGKALYDQLLEICKEHGIKEILCNVDLRAKNASESLGIILHQGFKCVKAEQDVILLRKGV